MIIASLPSRKQQICSLKTKITLINLIHCIINNKINQISQSNPARSVMFQNEIITSSLTAQPSSKPHSVSTEFGRW